MEWLKISRVTNGYLVEILGDCFVFQSFGEALAHTIAFFMRGYRDHYDIRILEKFTQENKEMVREVLRWSKE